MNLRNTPLYFKTGPEARQRKKINIGKYVYLSLLAALVIVLGRFAFDMLFYVTGVGQTIYDSINVQLDNDAQIDARFVNEGDNVKQGDTLIRFSYIRNENSLRPDMERQRSEMDRLRSETERLKSEIMRISMESRIQDIEKQKWTIQQADYKDKLSQLQSLSAFSMGEIISLKTKIGECEIAGSAAQQQTRTLRDEIVSLRAQVRADSLQLCSDMGTPTQIIRSPIAGQISEIYKDPHELAFKGNVVLTIRDTNQVRICAYFDQEDADRLHAGGIASLRFLNGSKGLGIIKRVYFSTKALPEEFQKKYDPVQRDLAVDIYPVNENEKANWKKYFKMNVEVKVRK